MGRNATAGYNRQRVSTRPHRPAPGTGSGEDGRGSPSPAAGPARAFRLVQPACRRNVVVGRRPAAARRLLAGGADRRRAGAAADRRGDRRARSRHVHIAGWHMTPGFGLTRDEERAAAARPARLGRRAGRRARAAVGGRAGARCSSPTRAAVRGAREELVRGTRIRCALDARERPMHCHHEKLVIVDGEVAFVGGIDLTSLGGDRFDSAPHPVRGGLGWHDVVDAPARPGRRRRRRALRGPLDGGRPARTSPVVPPPAAGRLDDGAGRPHGAREDLRLPAARRLPDPRGLHARAALGASGSIYLENQFLWSPEIVRDPGRQAAQSAARTTSGWWSCCPARPNNGADDTRGQLGVLVEADDGNERFLAATLLRAHRRGDRARCTCTRRWGSSTTAG